jgi:hypothetical protein
MKGLFSEALFSLRHFAELDELVYLSPSFYLYQSLFFDSVFRLASCIKFRALYLLDDASALHAPGKSAQKARAIFVAISLNFGIYHKIKI